MHTPAHRRSVQTVTRGVLFDSLVAWSSFFVTVFARVMVKNMVDLSISGIHTERA
jgi:hypothetical protein